MKLFAIFFAISIFATAHGFDFNERGVVNYNSIVDNVVKDILKSLKSFLGTVTLDDFKQNISGPGFNVSTEILNIEIENADNFNVAYLDTKLFPITIQNLTLTWKNVNITAYYDVSGSLGMEDIENVTPFFGNGEFGMVLHDIFFTISARFDFVNGKLQVPKGGLTKFDTYVRKANVTLESLMGSTELGEMVGIFIGSSIPDLINTFKKPMFEAFQEKIIEFLNSILRG